jgi:threonine dehydrogenase-like Zn-dependent dehydrogenase
MLALRVQNKRLSVRNVEKPDRNGEAVIRVVLSGICNTDLEIARGYAGFNGTIGHEFVGVVEQSPDVELIGVRVVGEINAGCGKCPLCKAGDPRHCPTRTVLGIVGRDGAHAEFLRLPTVNLSAVPEKIIDEHAVFTEPLAAACGILERTTIDKSDRVVVIGDGKLGLMCAQVIALTGAPTLLVGKHRPKLRIAQRRGIEIATVKETSKRKREFDVAIEASGSPSGLRWHLIC